VNAGLFVTNYPVDGFLSYERLKAARNDIICVRIMGWADGAPAVDYTVNAASGVPFMTGPSDHYAPVNHVLPAWDLLSGAYAAFMLVSAERKRRITGVGSDIRIPLSDIAAASLSHMGQLAEVLTEGRDRPRLGNALYGAFGRDFTTGDGRRVMVVAITPRQWKGLIATLDVATAISALETELKVSFATDEGARFIHRHRLFPIFETAFATRELSMLADAMDAEGVTWAPYQTLHQAASQDPRLFTQNPIFENTSNPSGEHYPAAGSAATLAGNVRGQVQRSPRLGEHTDEVLATVLGLGQAQIARLHDSGVVASPESLP
jgi:2-methylfumaryl-CoA isomerase